MCSKRESLDISTVYEVAAGTEPQLRSGVSVLTETPLAGRIRVGVVEGALPVVNRQITDQELYPLSFTAFTRQ